MADVNRFGADVTSVVDRDVIGFRDSTPAGAQEPMDGDCGGDNHDDGHDGPQQTP